MNTTVIIAAGIILALVILVYLLIASSKKAAAKNRQLLLNKLQQLAHQYNTSVGTHDFLGRKLIALDAKEERTFYINEPGLATEPVVIRLAEVSKSNVTKAGNKFTRTTKSGTVETEEHVNSIYLEVHMKDGRHESLLFYSEAKDGILEMQVLKQLAEKWQVKINSSV